MVRFELFYLKYLVFFCSIGLHSEVFNEEHFRNKRNMNKTGSTSPTPSDQSRVRNIINRYETSTSTSGVKSERKPSIKKPLRDENSDGSTSVASSPPVKRFARIDDNEKNPINGNSSNKKESFTLHQNGSREDDLFGKKKKMSNGIKFEVDNKEIKRTGQRIPSGTTVSVILKVKSFSYLFFIDG
jgi:hypothetical protein